METETFYFGFSSAVLELLDKIFYLFINWMLEKQK